MSLRQASRPEHKRSDPASGLFGHAGDDVRVDVVRDRDGGVAEHLCQWKWLLICPLVLGHIDDDLHALIANCDPLWTLSHRSDLVLVLATEATDQQVVASGTASRHAVSLHDFPVWWRGRPPGTRLFGELSLASPRIMLRVRRSVKPGERLPQGGLGTFWTRDNANRW
jgi:hypothetical protein